MRVVLIVFIFSVLFMVTNGEIWGYPDLENEEEFPEWGGLCDVGKRQSPIDLSVHRAFKGIFKDYTFRNYDRPLVNPRIENNGHTVKLKFDAPKLSVLGAGLKGEYYLQEVHFHWSSEHTIDDKRYPLEMHMVHMNGRYKNASEALKQSDGFAVFGILFHVSSNDSENIGKILKGIDTVSSSINLGKPRNITEKLILQNFLPSNPSRDYFFYKGSLTTPYCDESVTWTVYIDTKAISLEQIEQFSQIESENGKKVKNNFRPIQKLRNRPVTFVSKWDSTVKCGSGSLRLTSIGLMLVFVVALMNSILTQSI